jgi:hypothetical protein
MEGLSVQNMEKLTTVVSVMVIIGSSIVNVLPPFAESYVQRIGRSLGTEECNNLSIRFR